MANLSDILNIQAAATAQGVPIGGTTGQVLAKASEINYDTEWVDQLGGGGGGLSLRAQITSNTTLTASDASKYIPVNSATAINITINANVFAEADSFVIEQTGAGVVTLVAGSGMTLNGNLNSMGQYYILTVFFKSASVATVIGGE
jgi:hypothetical protein